MATVVLSGFILAAAAPWLARWWGRTAGWLLSFLPVALAIYLGLQLPMITEGRPQFARFSWVPALDVGLSLYLDGLSLLFALLITGIGSLIVIYSGGYLAGHPHRHRFYAFMLMFMASMLGLVLADDVIALFVFWELTSLSSYLLIGFDHERPAARAAALQALLVTGLGGLALLAGVLMLGSVAGSFELSTILARGETVRGQPLARPAMLLILVGAFTKSAQVPFHFWLPNAMEAPTPVSAYLHSATMVKAGVYLLARLNPLFAGMEGWSSSVTTIGAATMITGAVLAMMQVDLKRILAYSTVSALGLLTMLLGFGTEAAAAAAMVFLLAHALYKGALFLVAGVVDHETGVREITGLAGLGRVMRMTALAAGLSALAMAGLPPFLGFIGKELVYETTLHVPGGRAAWTTVTMAWSILYVAIAVISGIAPFVGPRIAPASTRHDGPVTLWLGPLVLGALGLAMGVAPGTVAQPLVEPAAAAVAPGSADVSLALWHGVNPGLALSIAGLLGGLAIYTAQGALRPALDGATRLLPWGPARAYEAGLDGLNRAAVAQTRVLQSGYLRYYLLLIVLAAAVTGWYTLLRSGVAGGPLRWEWGDARFHELVLAALIIAAAAWAARSPSRLGAVASLGVTGYGVALIYFIFGAPDLAITQFLVETLTVILFVLAFYHLPRFAVLSHPAARLRDAAVAVAAGGLMTLLVVAAAGSGATRAVSAYFAENSLLLGHGRNVVNVILVDFRALDTLGETVVLAVAGIGVYVLLKLRPPGRGR
ncbi:MAG: putative monovalent cation/H+ antiporter subunit A [Armatimonadota bacterium]|nr:putative monovalent cation/H+ antiporter subunit A [Armatimonadota bacterium]MDR7451020.1 putative monovalent cation/H+ antiporter subunit A [Armatimonadota bacterium]MDR7465959.1 putative monovalent cation/H+ antiporter subunit A [Armatimonadota bacterium]MDR7494024.1 putative monovalent cation/H+ antiporter subunit A [Armatimonadota bacterium]MDR7498474.1 putative monovalent cation/H+ antiporter subunit A [Armatimonadota bacterium]